MKSEKERIMEMVESAIDNRNQMILMVDDGDKTVLGLQGDPQKLSFMVVKAMQSDRKFENVFDIAVKAFRERGRGARPDFLEFIKALIDFEPLDCENCPVADQCKIRDEVHCEKEMPQELRDMLNQIFKAKKED